jgi:hypothetical protein
MAGIERYSAVRCEYGGPDPGKPGPGVMQVYYLDGRPEMVDFLCPCGCGFTCPTHLVKPGEKHHDHRWEYYEDERGPTLVPSIKWTGGCKAHFTITHGVVALAGDSGK